MVLTSDMQFQTRQTALPAPVSECDAERFCEIQPLARACRNVIPPSPSFRRQFVSSLASSTAYTRLFYSKLSLFRDHLSSCNAMMHDVAHLILATASMNAAFP
jgi:hypothetical protein